MAEMIDYVTDVDETEQTSEVDEQALATLPMKRATVSGKFASAHSTPLHELDRVDANGKPLQRFPKGQQLPYSHDYKEFVNIHQVRLQDAYPTDAEIVKMLNDAARAAARQAGMKVAQDAAGLVKPDFASNPELAIKQMVNTYLKSTNKKTGKLHTPEEARRKAEAAYALELD